MKIEEAELQKLQEEALSLLDSMALDHPLFVEFAGTPKSGKSTCIDTVSHFFRRLGYNVLAPTEGASKRTPYYLKDDLVAFNAWSATYALTHILEGRFGADKYHLVIMDRGIFDALAWFELLKTQNSVTEAECSTIQEFLLINHWQELVDVVFLFQTDPATSLERENRDKLIKGTGRAMNPTFLLSLNEAYKTIWYKYSAQFRSVHEVDTSGNQKQPTAQSTAFEVTTKIVEQMKLRN